MSDVAYALARLYCSQEGKDDGGGQGLVVGAIAQHISLPKHSEDRIAEALERDKFSVQTALHELMDHATYMDEVSFWKLVGSEASKAADRILSDSTSEHSEPKTNV